MISFIFIFYFVLYPYLIFAYFNKKYKNYILDNSSITNSPNNNYNIYILSTQNQNINPFYKNNNYNVKIVFDIPEDCDTDILENKIKYFKTEHYIHENYISLILNITEENENYIANIIKYAKYLYPTYSKIIFVYYESLPFISQLLRKNIDIMNNDATRNYFMINIKSLIYKLNDTKKEIDFSDIDTTLQVLESDKDKYIEQFAEKQDQLVAKYLQLSTDVTTSDYLYEELI